MVENLYRLDHENYEIQYSNNNIQIDMKQDYKIFNTCDTINLHKDDINLTGNPKKERIFEIKLKDNCITISKDDNINNNNNIKQIKINPPKGYNFTIKENKNNEKQDTFLILNNEKQDTFLILNKENVLKKIIFSNSNIYLIENSHNNIISHDNNKDSKPSLVSDQKIILRGKKFTLPPINNGNNSTVNVNSKGSISTIDTKLKQIIENIQKIDDSNINNADRINVDIKLLITKIKNIENYDEKYEIMYLKNIYELENIISKEIKDLTSKIHEKKTNIIDLLKDAENYKKVTKEYLSNRVKDIDNNIIKNMNIGDKVNDDETNVDTVYDNIMKHYEKEMLEKNMNDDAKESINFDLKEISKLEKNIEVLETIYEIIKPKQKKKGGKNKSKTRKRKSKSRKNKPKTGKIKPKPRKQKLKTRKRKHPIYIVTKKSL